MLLPRQLDSRYVLRQANKSCEQMIEDFPSRRQRRQQLPLKHAIVLDRLAQSHHDSCVLTSAPLAVPRAGCVKSHARVSMLCTRGGYDTALELYSKAVAEAGDFIAQFPEDVAVTTLVAARLEMAGILNNRSMSPHSSAPRAAETWLTPPCVVAVAVCACSPARLFLAMSPPMFDEAEQDALRVMALCRGAEKVKMGTPKEGVEEAHKFEARSKESAEGSTEEKLSAKAKRKQRKRAKAAKAVDDQRSSVGGIARALLGEVRRQRRQANAGNAGKAAQGGEG